MFCLITLDEEVVRIFLNVVHEMGYQDNLWGSQRALPNLRWNAILVEEVGEVAKAILEEDHNNLERELVQVAAVCVQWLKAKALA